MNGKRYSAKLSSVLGSVVSIIFLWQLACIQGQVPPSMGPKVQQTVTFGGRGGSAFDDNANGNIAGIIGMRIHHGAVIDSIQVTYRLKDGSTYVSPRRGGTGGVVNSFTLADGERLNMMVIDNGTLVNRFTFYSNFNQTYGPYGGRGGRFRVESPEIIAFFGQSDDNNLNAVGMHILEPPLTAMVSANGTPAVEESGYSLICTVMGTDQLNVNNPTINYQWLKDNTVVPGETQSTLSFSSLSLSDAGQYRCDVTVSSTLLSQPIIAMSNTQDLDPLSGFCDAEMITQDKQTFSWPLTSSGVTISIQCPGLDSTQRATRVCGRSGQWEDPDITFCSLCEAESVSLPGEAAVYVWPATLVGVNATIPCIASNEMISRECLSGGIWGSFDDDICGVLDDALEMLLNQVVNNQTLQALAANLSSVLNASESNVADQGQDNLRMIAKVFEKVAEFVNGSDVEIAPAVVQHLLQSLSSLLQWNATVLINTSSSDVVESFEVVVALFAQQVEIGEKETVVVEDLVFVAEMTLLETLQQNGRGFIFSETLENESVVELAGSEAVSPSGLAPQALAAIRLPPLLFQTIDDSIEGVGVFFVVYDVPSLFPPEDQNTAVGTRILASTVGPAGFDFSDLQEPVSISLREPDTEQCVSWDFTLDDWTPAGCKTIVGSDGIVTCNCTHLTNFAVLVDICRRTGSCANPVLDKVLSFITYIGATVSMISLVLTVVTLLFFRKLRNLDPSKFHVQLSIAIFCMLLVFVVGVERTENHGCVVVSLLIHYFTLVAVMFMGAEAVLMFQKLVIVFVDITTKYFVIVSLVCWLVPLIPVLVPLIIDLANGTDSLDIVTKPDQFCFLNHLGALYGAFFGWIFLIIIFIVVIFCIVIFILIKHTREKLNRQNEHLKPSTAIRLMISITGIMSLFGFSWAFGALTVSVSELSTIFQILFTVFTVFQGFFIFLFFCVLNKESRDLWKEVLTCGKFNSKHLHKHVDYKSHTNAKQHNKLIGVTNSTTPMKTADIDKRYGSGIPLTSNT